MAKLNNLPVFDLRLKSGLKANLLSLWTLYDLFQAEPLYTTDEKALYLADGSSPSLPLPVLGQFPFVRSLIDYVVLVSDFYVAITNTAIPRIVTLPSAVTVGASKSLIVKDESGGALVNNITVTPVGGETIDGAPVFLIALNYGVCRLVSDGANWFTW